MSFREALNELKKQTGDNTQNIELLFKYLDQFIEKVDSFLPQRSGI